MKHIRVLFITMVWPINKNDTNMYTDLMHEFVSAGHKVTVLSLMEKRNDKATYYAEENGLSVLRIRCGNIQKTNKYQKVISSLLANIHLLRGIKKYCGSDTYDLIIFALPPVTVYYSLKKIKQKYKAKFYLLLKEFWPQDPADLGAMKKNGFVWRFFDRLTKGLYSISDYIGTMSDKGIDFLRNNTSKISAIIETCPNCLSDSYSESEYDRNEILIKYGIPTNKIIGIFGGNLGVSQGIPEMIKCIKAISDFPDYQIVIVGNGTESGVVKQQLSNQDNVSILDWLPTKEFEVLLQNSDIGFIFLNPNYTVPNIPSRMIGYLKYGIPIVACIDSCTDVGEIITEADCGYAMKNGDINMFRNALIQLRDQTQREQMGAKGKDLFNKQYTAKCCYHTIINHFE